MKRLTLSLLLLFISVATFSQTIDKKPIFKNPYASLEIVEMKGGSIVFLYQNPEYTTIVNIVSFRVNSKESALALMDKIIYLLEMEKTGKDEHIRDKFETIDLVRYSFSQKRVDVSNGKDRGLSFNKTITLKIKTALEEYNYNEEINK